ncbi:hypothetical protein J3B02_006082, partial [Coemansia erecta]
ERLLAHGSASAIGADDAATFARKARNNYLAGTDAADTVSVCCLRFWWPVIFQALHELVSQRPADRRGRETQQGAARAQIAYASFRIPPLAAGSRYPSLTGILCRARPAQLSGELGGMRREQCLARRREKKIVGLRLRLLLRPATCIVLRAPAALSARPYARQRQPF